MKLLWGFHVYMVTLYSMERKKTARPDHHRLLKFDWHPMFWFTNYLQREILYSNPSFHSFSVGGFQVLDLARRHRQPNYREMSTFYFSDRFCMVTIETKKTFEWNKQNMFLWFELPTSTSTDVRFTFTAKYLMNVLH